jgi:hypothetical protein
MKTSARKVSPISRLQGTAPAQAVPIVQVRQDSLHVHQTSPLTSPALLTQASAPRRRWWHSIGNSSRYSSFVFVGSGLVFMERLERVAEPVVFLWRNLGILARALFYLAVPAATSALLLWAMPHFSARVLQPGWVNALWLAGFYVSNAFGLLVTGFLGRALLKGFGSSIDMLAQRGRTALVQDPDTIPAPEVVSHAVKPAPFSPSRRA